MYGHFFPYITLTYDNSNNLLSIVFKSVENRIFFNDRLCRNGLLRTNSSQQAQRYEHAAY